MEVVTRRVAKFASGRPGAIRSAVAAALGLAALATVVGCQGQSEVAVRDKPEAPVFSGLPSGTAASTAATAAAKARLVQGYGKLPLSFELNRGQADARVKFLSRGSGYTLFLTPTEAVLDLRRPESGPSALSHSSGARPEAAADATRTVLRMRLVGGNPDAEIRGLEQLPGKSNYFIGDDPKNWRTHIPAYRKVAYHQVYPGIDLVYYGRKGQLEYDFVVAPRADPVAIRLSFQGAEELSLDDQGNLILHTPRGEVIQKAPLVYQEIGGVRQAVRGGYVLHDTGEVGFDVAAYDAGKALRIDPVFSYSTYLGGSGSESGLAIAVDAAGNAYVMGVTLSLDFPTVGPIQTDQGRRDAFVSKLNAAGSALVYSTYLGGSDLEFGEGIAVDAAGNAYVTGTTNSTDFPTKNPLQVTIAGVADAFVTKLNSTGSALLYSTYLGGSISDVGLGIAVDSAGNAYVTGGAGSADFPTTTNAFQSTIGGPTGGDTFVTKLNAQGSALVYSTYLGGGFIDRGNAIAVDSAGNAYVTGETQSANFPTVGPIQTDQGGSDAFVSKLNAAGSALVYSTYLGGSEIDGAIDIAVDAAGNTYVTGQTLSSDFPMASPLQGAFGGGTCGVSTCSDAFVTKLNASGSALIYSTFLGGSDFDLGRGIAADAAGNAFVTGRTDSTDFPTATPIQSSFGGGTFQGDAFVSKLNAAGSALVYSTYLGGSRDDDGLGIAVDVAGNAYVTGTTDSTDFPTKNPLQPALGGTFPTNDAFVAKIAIGTDVIINPMPWLMLLLDD